MIVGVPKKWLRMTLMVKGSTLPQTWKRIVMTTAFSAVVTLLWGVWGLERFTLSTTPFALVGVALSIFLGFRNNTSYDRFWEGRKLWGRMVNVSRTFTRQVLTLIHPGDRAPPTEKQRARVLGEELVRRHIAYVHALRMHLRDEIWEQWTQLDPFIGEAERAALKPESNRPAAISHRSGELLADAFRRGWIEAHLLANIDASLTEMIGVQGACERIKSTPVPFVYQVLTHRFVGVYCIALTFGLHDTVGLFTPLVVAFVSFAFYGLAAIGDAIAEPFGYDPNDLPLMALSRMIEINLRQRLGDEHLPPLHRPRNGVLD